MVICEDCCLYKALWKYWYICEQSFPITGLKKPKEYNHLTVWNYCVSCQKQSWPWLQRLRVVPISHLVHLVPLLLKSPSTPFLSMGLKKCCVYWQEPNCVHWTLLKIQPCTCKWAKAIGLLAICHRGPLAVQLMPQHPKPCWILLGHQDLKDRLCFRVLTHE